MKTERALLVTLLDLFVAGGETASANLTWAVLYLAGNPTLQAEVHREIDSVIGRDRLPEIRDKAK